jgi:cobalt-precorrin 5A hydrolase
VIDEHVNAVLAANGWSAASLAAVATVDLKLDEPGLIAFAATHKLPLLGFTRDELARQAGIERPSEQVRSRIGIAAVAEPAALRAAGATRLAVPKQVGPGVTAALARTANGQEWQMSRGFESSLKQTQRDAAWLVRRGIITSS